MTNNIEVCGKTNIGLKRKRNEDSYLIVDKLNKIDIHSLGMLFVVADGMGGHPAGDMASKLACEGLKRYYYHISFIRKKLFSMSKYLLLKHLATAIEATQKMICTFESQHKECAGFGTTLSTLILAKTTALIGHIGDSRIYRLRDNSLGQLTTDDTLVQDMVNMGELKSEEAAEIPYRHVLTQALGGGYEKVHIYLEEVKAGDIFLLCTDGLHDLVSKDEIKEILSADITVVDICNQLLNAALRRGGKDNITAIVVRLKN